MGQWHVSAHVPSLSQPHGPKRVVNGRATGLILRHHTSETPPIVTLQSVLCCTSLVARRGLTIPPPVPSSSAISFY